MRESLGMALLERRDELGLSQLQIATRTGMSQTRISNLEVGDTGCTVVHLWQLAEALEVTPVELVERTARAMAVLSDPRMRRIFWLGRARVRAGKLRTE
ncbi:MAG TPA: helix-turn-helix transcriptional regulator [Gemmatimonadaceae bacterium]|nr:helix-turn-helix transcriptional regulator [Gemmatimonadaceae bacterium]